MNNPVIYLIEITVSMALFYGLWYALLRRDTFFVSQRFYFLGTSIISLLIPFVEIGFPERLSDAMNMENIREIIMDTVTVTTNKSGTSIVTLLPVIYIGISMLFLFRFGFRLLAIKKLKNNSRLYHENGVKVYVSEASISAFSFMHSVFINQKDFSSPQFQGIFKHEQSHVKQKHTYDLLWIEALTILFWINPLIYLYRKQLKTIHEYLSDEKVILQDFEPDEYKMLLIRQQLGYIYELANYFNHSVTLKRIHMLNRIKSPKLAKLKYLLVIPIIGILPFLFSFSDKPFDDGNQVAEVRDTILTEADEMPVFPGGESALLTFIAKNVKYPEVSKKNGIQGKVFVQFMVDKTGKVKAIEVLQGVSKELDAEAVRVIKLLPNFEKPAYKDGKPVNVKMVLPIMFKLQ